MLGRTTAEEKPSAGKNTNSSRAAAIFPILNDILTTACKIVAGRQTNVTAERTATYIHIYIYIYIYVCVSGFAKRDHLGHTSDFQLGIWREST